MLKVYLSERQTAYDLLALALREQYGMSVLPLMGRAEYGKPFFPEHPALRFNVSHSGAWSLCAVGDENVGADVETVRPRSAGLPRHALSTLEYQRFEASGGSWEAFYALWTAREAWSKYTGQGVARSRRREIPEGLCLRAFRGEGWAASVCAQSAVGDLLIR